MRRNAPDQRGGIQRTSLHGSFSSERGTLHWYCLDHWSQRLDMDIPALKRELQHMISMRPHVIEFLTRLHASHRDVVMVTNAHRKTLEIKMDQVDITRWFDRVVVSHDLQAPKEEQAFWHRLQDTAPVRPGAHPADRRYRDRCWNLPGTMVSPTCSPCCNPTASGRCALDTRFPGIHHFDEIMPGASSPHE